MQDMHCGSCAPAKKSRRRHLTHVPFALTSPPFSCGIPEPQLGDLGTILPLSPGTKHTCDKREHCKAFWKSTALPGDGQEQLCQTRSLSAGGLGDTAAKQSSCS